jgi:hypothetical protein
MSLFQFWNVNRFQNPISISRDEVMKVSKICAKATYHKCMRELHNFGYLQYVPSYNPFKGSLIYLVVFDPDYQPVQKTERRHTKKQTSTGTGMCTSTEQALVPYINNINITNIKNDSDENSQTQFFENENLSFPKNDNLETLQSKNSKRKKVAPKKEKDSGTNPALDEVVSFFKSENYPQVEAQKFFNHFESNGWKVGGKTPMKNWQAAARNWMLNAKRFAPATQQQSKVNPNGKNYNEPL